MQVLRDPWKCEDNNIKKEPSSDLLSTIENKAYCTQIRIVILTK